LGVVYENNNKKFFYEWFKQLKIIPKTEMNIYS
jgi:hypothetical protein